MQQKNDLSKKEQIEGKKFLNEWTLENKKDNMQNKSQHITNCNKYE